LSHRFSSAQPEAASDPTSDVRGAEKADKIRCRAPFARQHGSGAFFDFRLYYNYLFLLYFLILIRLVVHQPGDLGKPVAVGVAAHDIADAAIGPEQRAFIVLA